jgi:predicted dinucleotide-utilizing enzyme
MPGIEAMCRRCGSRIVQYAREGGNMDDLRLRVGVIGVGMIALVRNIPALRQTGKAEIVAICRRDAEALRRIQDWLQVPHAYTDWRQMLEEVELDAVLVCTPHDLHYEQSMAALQRGLHVLVEKPMALAASEAWSAVRSSSTPSTTPSSAIPSRTASSAAARSSSATPS